MVDTAVMHVMEGTACTSELRISAMHEVNPLHMFMFNSRGRTLNMNHAAMEACRYSGQTPLIAPHAHGKLGFGHPLCWNHV